MKGVPWSVGVGLGLLAAALVSMAAAQPGPSRPGTPRQETGPMPGLVLAAANGAPGQPSGEQPSGDPIGELLERISGAQAPPQMDPVVLDVRLGEEGERSRFVIELSDSVDVHVFTLIEPNRVVIDMPEVLWRVADNERPTGRGVIESYRYGLFREGNSRFVIDLNAPVRAEAPQLLPPEGTFGFRLVIDLYPTTPEEFAANVGWPEELGSLPAVANASPEQALPERAAVTDEGGEPSRDGTEHIVVIDAGHGGIDPGTHGASGLQEKAVVLDVAKKLRDALEATGRFKVYLTRDNDVFIPLRGRVDIARAVNAELLVSLHLDSNDHREVRGASVYTLSEDASDREAASLAEKENRSDIIAGIDLSDDASPVAAILIDLAQRDTMNRSVRFAESVLTDLQRATSIRPSSPHRSAGFAVLKAPDIPAVLIEMGYITNPADEKQMLTSAWRASVAAAITAAIERHFASVMRPTTLQAAIP